MKSSAVVAERSEEGQVGTPFNLSDVVPFLERTKPTIDGRDYGDARKFLDWAKSAQELSASGGLEDGDRESLSRIALRNSTFASNAVRTAFAECGWVPDDMMNAEPNIKAVASLPRVDMAELRRVVNVLDMVVMPFEYLTPASYEKEDYRVQASISKFDKMMSAQNLTLQWATGRRGNSYTTAPDGKSPFKVYVAAPLRYYDVTRHVASASDEPIFASNRAEPALLALTMAMPMFRSIFSELNQLRDRSNEQQRRFNEVTLQVQGLNHRLSQLESMVERQQAEQVRQALVQREMQAELRRVEARSTFMAYEPMMIAIPSHRSVMSDGWALVGPCWGPDFDAIVMTALQLRKYDGQRAELGRVVAKLQGY